MRKDCALSVLTEEQQTDLFDWLTTDTYDVVLKRLALPPPDGFGIKTHINSLYRFYERRQAQLRAQDLAALSTQEGRGSAPRAPLPSSPQSSALSPQSFENTQSSVPGSQSFFTAAAAAFSHTTYMLANSPLTYATYRAVSRTLHQHENICVKREYLDVARQQLALSRERLQFDRAQFEYNAARAALAILPELIAIDQMTDIDDEAKIWRVRDRLFGSSPASPSMPNDRCSMIDPQCAGREGDASDKPLTNLNETTLLQTNQT